MQHRRTRPDEREIFARLVELEAGVQRRGWIRPVLARRKHDQVCARRQRHARKGPLRRVGLFVREVMAGQVDPAGRGIVDLDPIGKGTVLVGECGRVVGHDFRDDEMTGGLNQQHFKRGGVGAERVAHSEGVSGRGRELNIHTADSVEGLGRHIADAGREAEGLAVACIPRQRHCFTGGTEAFVRREAVDDRSRIDEDGHRAG